MKTLRILSIVMLVALAIMAFVACNVIEDENKPEETTPEVTTSESTTDEATSEEITTDEATTNSGELTTDEKTTTEETTETQNKVDEWKETYDVISFERALELCGEPGNLTTERYYIIGTIKTITNAQYGAMVITDGINTISVYGTYSADGSIGYAEFDEKPFKDDIVLLHCTLQNYNGTKEIKNARLIDFQKAEIVIDETEYTDMSISDVRNVAVDTKVKVDGVVARITYANGYKPSGYYLVDETQCIYVYDADSAQRVQIGNKVTIIGSKTYWILDTEKNNADKFGYKGCNQIENVKLINNDNGTHDFDKSWITESTVKDLLETPVTEDITTTIFKVNALVKKVPGNGFVNYYFFDLDGETGAYTYTQCNGGDFEWLDEFDGKICTVYLSAINAKSTATDCYFRLLPVSVVFENFKFDTTNAPEYAVKYHGVGQFLAEYTGNPKSELLTSISSELLGFDGVTLTYTSDNTDNVYFTTEGNKTILNCKGTGTANVTITATYNGVTFSDTVTVTVTAASEFNHITVKEAIDTAVDEEVYVKGIVGPSIVNKSGFYLIDETGVIAIICDAAQFEGLKIGHEVIVKGTRENYKNDEKANDSQRFGQTCLVDGVIVANYYGNNQYSTASFVTDKTIADFDSLKITEDHTTTVFVLEATVKVVEATYYTNIYITDGAGIEILLYCSSANQYSWLKAYNGQKVTIEMVPCNWNDKKDSYRGCVLALYGEDGIVYNELNFLK